jgi:Tfp pilus assembly protein PilF
VSCDDRLDSWKEIAAYLKRGVRTAQRWERVAGLPVHRVASQRGGAYAFRSEIDAWWRTRGQRLDQTAVSRPRLTAAAGPSSPPSASSSMPVRTFLGQNIGVDPDLPRPHANLAVYFFTLVAIGLMRPDEGMPAARAAARRAIDLDPSNPDANALAATVTALYDGDWLEAERRFDAALAAATVPPAVRFHYATWFLSPLRRHAEALAQLRLGLVDEPLYLLARVHIGMELHSLGRPEEGLAELEQVLTIDPQFGPALGMLGRELALRRRFSEARQLIERTYAAIPRHPNAVGALAGHLRREGDAARGEELFAALGATSAWAVPRARAESHLICGEIDVAVQSMALSVAARDPGIWLLLSGTAGTLLRSARGWPALRAQLKAPG